MSSLKTLLEKIIHETGHGDLAMAGLMVEDGDEEPGDHRRVVPGTCHGGLQFGAEDVTLVTDLEQTSAGVFKGLIKHGVVEGEGACHNNGLNDHDDVEDDDGFLHVGYELVG